MICEITGCVGNMYGENDELIKKNNMNKILVKKTHEILPKLEFCPAKYYGHDGCSKLLDRVDEYVSMR